MHRYAMRVLVHSLAHVASLPTLYRVVAVSLRANDYMPKAEFEDLSYTVFRRVLGLLTDPEVGSGLCRLAIGTFDRITGKGTRTRVEPRIELKDRLLKAGLIWSTHPFNIPSTPAGGLLFLKDSKTGSRTALTRPLWQEELVLPLVNARLANSDIKVTFPNYQSYERQWDFRSGTFSLHTGNDQLYRQFVDNERSGGRVFGHFAQSVPKALRPYLTIDGEHVFEYDYQGMQVAVGYDLIGQEAPYGDPYDIPGYGPSKRGIFKACFTSAAGADAENTSHNLMAVFSHAVMKQTGTFLQPGEAENMAMAFWEYHAPLKQLAGTQAWRELQRRESEIILEVLRRLEEQGIPAIPIHDAALVPLSHQQSLRRAMIGATRDLSTPIRVQPAAWTLEAYPQLF